MNVKTIKEIYKEELMNFKNSIENTVKDTFNDYKEIPPLLFTLTIKEGKLVISGLHGLGQLFALTEGKQKARDIIRQFSKEIKPIAIVFATEAWASSYSEEAMDYLFDENGKLDEDFSPSARKDMEIITIQFETYDECAQTYLRIERNDNEVNLKPYHSTDWHPKKDSDVKGLFTGLLEENYGEIEQWLREKLNTKYNLN